MLTVCKYIFAVQHDGALCDFSRRALQQFKNRKRKDGFSLSAFADNAVCCSFFNGDMLYIQNFLNAFGCFMPDLQAVHFKIAHGCLSSFLTRFGVKYFTHAIAQQVECKHCYEYGKARKHTIPPNIRKIVA